MYVKVVEVYFYCAGLIFLTKTFVQGCIYVHCSDCAYRAVLEAPSDSTVVHCGSAHAVHRCAGDWAALCHPHWQCGSSWVLSCHYSE